MRKLYTLAIAATVIASGMIGSAAKADLIFNDTFNTASSEDINSGIAERQTGTIGTVAYNECWGSTNYRNNFTQVSNGAAPDALFFHTPINDSSWTNLWAGPNYDFATVTGYTNWEYELVADPMKEAANPYWDAVAADQPRLAFKIGCGYPNRDNSSPELNRGLVFELRDFADADGNLFTIYDDGAKLTSGAFAAHTGNYDVKIATKKTTTGLDVDFFLDGTNVYSYSRVGDFTSNYVTLGGMVDPGSADRAGTQVFDNLSVSASNNPPVPEPTGLLGLLTGLSGLAGMKLYRRK